MDIHSHSHSLSIKVNPVSRQASLGSKTGKESTQARITRLIASSIRCGLTSERAKRKRVIAAPLTGKQSEIQGPLREFESKLRNLWKSAEVTEQALKNIAAVFVEAAQVKRDKLKIMKNIEENLGILAKATDEYEDGRRILAQLQDRFADNKSAQRTIKEAKQLLSKLEDNLRDAKDVILDIASDQAPVVLTEDDPTFKDIMDFINKGLTNTDIRPKPKVTEVWYNLGMKTPGVLRFAAFIEIPKMPIIDGTRRTAYIAVATNMKSIRNQKGSYGKSLTGEFSPLEMYAVDKIVDPTKLVENSGYHVKSYKSIERTISYYAQLNNWAVFSNILKGDPQERLATLKDKLPILGKDGVKIRVNWPTVTVGVPTNTVVYVNGEVDARWWMSLFSEVKRVLELPSVGTVRVNVGDEMLKYEGTRKNSSKSNPLQVFTFKMSAVSPNIRAKKNLSYADIPQTYVHPIDEDLHTLGDNEADLKDLFRQALKELGQSSPF